MSKTIAAYSGGSLPAAIGIIRLSGPEAGNILSQMFLAKSGAASFQPRHMYYGKLLDSDGATLDICMACFLAAPATYTGEDMAEIYCHGSQAVVDGALAHAFALGAIPAQAGEFTKQAFLAGKLDLIEAEAVADLIYSTSPLAAKTAAAQLEGRIGTSVRDIREAVSGVLAHFYAVCDYSDEDIDPFESQKAQKILAESANKLDSLAQSFNKGQFISGGIPVAIIGKPNTGKSSLFNYLCGYDKAIVTDEEGTTRDVLDAVITVGGVPIRLLDTAGIRRAGGKVEEIGIRRAKKAAEESHACLCLIDGTTPCSLHDAESAVLALGSPNPAMAFTKSDRWSEGQASQRLIELYSMLEDRTKVQFDHVFHISTATGDGLEEVDKWLSGLMGQSPETIVTSARQAALAASAAQDLQLAAQSAGDGMTADAFLSDVERALATIGQITGETASPDIANEIFSRFCVGK